MILPQLQEALVVASDGLVARQRRRSQRFRLGLMTSAAVVTLGGGAVASQPLWAPLLGLDDAQRPSVATTDVPRAQRDALAVLRRDQTAGDRGPAAQQALRLLNRRYSGVRLTDIRTLRSGAATAPTLVSVHHRRAPGPRTSTTAVDALCLVVPDRTEGSVPRCFTLADVQSGRAAIPVGDRIWGLVPDRVSTVRFAVRGRPPVTVGVRENAFEGPIDSSTGTVAVSWTDASGAALPFADGATTRQIAVPVRAATVPAGMHDCGPRRGGVVPTRLTCGSSAARRYTPAAGTGSPGTSAP